MRQSTFIYQIHTNNFLVQKEEIGKSDRKALFGNRDETSGDYIASDQDYDQRTRLLQGTNRLEQSSQRLLESQRIANETEGIGASILRDLHGQRNQLEHSLEMVSNYCKIDK